MYEHMFMSVCAAFLDGIPAFDCPLVLLCGLSLHIYHDCKVSVTRDACCLIAVKEKWLVARGLCAVL